MISPSLGKTFWLVECLLFIALNSGFRCFVQSSQHDGLYLLVRDAFLIFSPQLCARIADSYCSPCSSYSSPVGYSLQRVAKANRMPPSKPFLWNFFSHIIRLHVLFHRISNILWSSLRSPACQVQPHFQPKHLTFYVLQLHSFLILSKEKLKDLICTTSSFASCLFISATVSEPDSIAALTDVFFSFIRADTLPSHTAHDISPHPSQPASMLFFPSFSHLWLFCLVLKISHLPFHCSMSPHPSTCSSLKLNFALGC